MKMRIPAWLQRLCQPVQHITRVVPVAPNVDELNIDLGVAAYDNDIHLVRRLIGDGAQPYMYSGAMLAIVMDRYPDWENTVVKPMAVAAFGPAGMARMQVYRDLGYGIDDIVHAMGVTAGLCACRPGQTPSASPGDDLSMWPVA